MGHLYILALLLATTAGEGRNRLQRIASLDPVPALYSDCRADVVFLLDGSGSVKIDNWIKTLDFVQDFAARVEYGKDKMHFGVASFGNLGSINLQLNEEKTFEGFREKVKNIRYKDENTNTADGLRKMREIFESEYDRPDVPNIGIVITDGIATKEVESTLPQAQLVRDAGIILLGIGVGAQLDISQLHDIVANKQAVYDVQDFDVLLSKVEDLVGDACKAVAEPSTTTAAPEDSCFSRDIAFVLDASGSVGNENFEKIKQFTRDFVERMPVGPLNNQVSLITYSTESYVHARLGQYPNKFELLQVIDNLQYIGRRTNTSGAIRTVHEIFKHEQDRKSSENIAIVISDGKSNTDEDRLVEDVNRAKWQGDIKFFTIGVGEKADYFEMAVIANQPTFEFANFEDDFDTLLATTTLLYDHICKRPEYAPFSMTYDIPAPMEGGQLAYSGSVIFVMDASPSVDLELFNLQTSLIKAVTQKLRVLPEIKYGIVQFGNEGITHVGLNSYESLIGFDYELERLTYKQEDVNLASGLDHIETLFEERIQSGIIKAENLKPQIVMLTSGKNIYNMELFQNKLAALKIKYPLLHLLPVALGQYVYTPELLKILSGKLNVELFSKLENRVGEELAHYLAYLIASNAAYPMWHCDFEKIDEELEVVPSTCELTQLETDEMDWLIESGETKSRHTGPLKAANGTYYAYIEATNRRPGDKAVLVGEKFNFEGPVCFSFKYNMHGWHAGKLEVVHFIPGWPEWTVWRKFGPQGQEWHEGMVHIYAHPTSKVGIRATRAQGFSGDIAVDDIKLSRGPCPIMKQFVEDPRLPKAMPILKVF